MKNFSHNSSDLRSTGLLFLASPFAFIVVILAAILGFSEVGVFEKITPTQLRSIQVAWSIFNTFGGLAVLFGMAGVVSLALILKHTQARIAAWVAMISGLVVIAVCILFVVLRISVVDFREATLDLNQRYLVSDWSFLYLVGPLSMIATASIGFGLFTSGFLQITGLVVTIVSIVLLILAILSGFPPFIYAFLWLIIGIALLRKKGNPVVLSAIPVS